MPLCLSRKPKRAESEIPSLPEAGPAVLSFERQHGKINGHLLREPLGHAVLLPHGLTALGPVVCCCWLACAVYFGRTFNPVQPSRSLHSPYLSVYVYHSHSLLFSPLSSFLITYHLYLHSHSVPKTATLWQTSFTITFHPFADNNYELSVCITLCECVGWCDPHLCEHPSTWERREDFCAVVFIFPPSQHHGYQSDSAKVGPPHKFRNL